MSTGEKPAEPEVAGDDLLVSRAIVRLAELGSFSAAARVLGVSVSAVTRALQRHEQRLGVALFLRSTHGLSPTVAGRRYVEHLQRWLQEEDGMRAALGSERRAETGSLRITVPVFVAEQLMVETLRKFRQCYPAVSVDVHASDDNRDVIREGFDLAIRLGPLPSSNLRTRAVGSFLRWVVASPSLFAGQTPPSDPRALAGFECLVFSSRTEEKWDFWSADGQLVQVALKSSLRSNNLELLQQLCIQGFGISRLPDVAVRPAIARGALVQLFPDYSCMPNATRPTFYALHAKDPGKDRLRDALVKTLQETARLSLVEADSVE